MIGTVLYFWIPNPADFYSGGNLYNAKLMEALIENGQVVKRLDEEALKAMAPTLDEGVLFVDTLYLDTFQKLQENITFSIPTLLIVHHLESLFPPAGWSSAGFFATYEQSKLQLFSAFLCTSDFTRQYLLKQLGPKRYVVVPPATGFRAGSTFTKTDKIKALLVANLVERKGILPFLKALMQQGGGEWLKRLSITIIGSFELEPDYAEACTGLLDSKPEWQATITFKGALPHEATLSAYSDANLFISTSFMETFGMAIQEALAFGLPVLALDGGNTRNHNLERRGRLFNDLPDLAYQLKRFCRNPKEWQQLQKSVKTAPSGPPYDWSQAAQTLINQLRALM